LKEGFKRKQERREKKERRQKRTNRDQRTYISKNDEEKARITIDKERGKKDSKKKDSKENKIIILYSMVTNAKYGQGGSLASYLV